MGDTVPSTPSASESSSGNEEPRPSLSRQKKYRVLLRVGSPALLKRERFWKDRVAKRLKDVSIPASSSEDEDPNAAAFYAAVLQSSVQPRLAHSEGTYAKEEARAALKRLPRPSEVVPDLDAGSASDAGCDKELKEAHKRRVKSTEISIQYLNREGTQDPVPPWTLELCGLKRYTRYMFPPPEDQNIKPYRVPLAFLSRSYRGSLLRTHKIGANRTKRKKRSNSSKGPPLVSPNGCAEVDHSDHGCIADLEYGATSTDSDIHSRTRTSRKSAIPSNPEQSERQKSNKELLQQVLAENASGSSDSDRGEKSCSDASPQISPVTLKGVQSSSAAEDPKDHLSELFKMIEENPDALFADASKVEHNAVDSIAAEVTTGENGTYDDNVDIVRTEQNLSQFDLEKRKGADFCRESVALKRPRSSVGMEILKMEPDRARAKLDNTALTKNVPSKEYDASSKTLRMMQKMGFKGRLGAKEDGILEPIKARSTEGRFGLGLRSEHDVVMGRPMAELPTSLKGKDVETIMLDEDVPKQAQEETTDFFLSRKQHRANVVGSVPGLTSGVGGGGEVKNVGGNFVDEEDEFESDQEDTYVDNGRRAILIEVDALMNNSRERRMKAFQKLFESVESLAKGFDINGLLNREKQDLCDSELLSKFLHSAGLDTSEATAEKLQDDLDVAFMEGDKPEWNHEVMQVLKQYSRQIHFGFLHKGSRRRMNHEMASMGVSQHFLNGSRATVKHGDDWPYSMTWQDLLCRVGVRARQTLFLVGGQDVNGPKLLGGVVASSIVGAHPLVMMRTEHGIQVQMLGNEKTSEVRSGVIGKDHMSILDDFVKKQGISVRRRRVLALYSADGLWYAGREEFGKTHEYAKDHGSSLVSFYGYENQEWVEDDCVFPLTRGNFRKMRDAGFGGIFDPGDVEDM